MTTYTANYLLSLPASEVKAIMTGTTGWKTLRAQRGLVSAQMSKAQMIQTVLELQGQAPAPMIPLIPAAPAVLAQSAQDWAGSGAEHDSAVHHVMTETGADEETAEAALAQVETLTVDPLASLRGVLSPALLAQADEAVAAAIAGREAAAREAAVFKAEAVRLANIIADQSGQFGAAAASTPSHAPLRQTGTLPLRTVLGCGVGRYNDVQVPTFKCPAAPAIDPDYIWPEGSGYLLATLTRGQHVFVFGDAGTGKTSFGRQWAARTGRPYYAVSFASDKAGYHLVGTDVPDGNGGLRWKDGELLAHMQVPGAVISLEELGYARSDLVAHLLSALEDGVVHLAHGAIRVAPGVQFLATNNDDGTGSKAGQYAGVRAINRALLDRFAARWEFTSLTAEREARALMGRCPGLKAEVAKVMVAFRKTVSTAVERGEAEHGVGIRRLIGWGSQVAQGLPSEHGFKGSVLNSAPADDAEFYQQAARAELDHGAIDAMQAGVAPAPAPAAPAPAEVPATERGGFQPF